MAATLNDDLTAARQELEAARRLTESRRALLEALDGIDEAAYCRLGVIGREEYSVLSVLENVAHHDREHAVQLQSIVAAGSASG